MLHLILNYFFDKMNIIKTAKNKNYLRIFSSNSGDLDINICSQNFLRSLLLVILLVTTDQLWVIFDQDLLPLWDFHLGHYLQLAHCTQPHLGQCCQLLLAGLHQEPAASLVFQPLWHYLQLAAGLAEKSAPRDIAGQHRPVTHGLGLLGAALQ